MHPWNPSRGTRDNKQYQKKTLHSIHAFVQHLRARIHNGWTPYASDASKNTKTSKPKQHTGSGYATWKEPVDGRAFPFQPREAPPLLPRVRVGSQSHFSRLANPVSNPKSCVRLFFRLDLPAGKRTVLPIFRLVGECQSKPCGWEAFCFDLSLPLKYFFAYTYFSNLYGGQRGNIGQNATGLSGFSSHGSIRLFVSILRLLFVFDCNCLHFRELCFSVLTCLHGLQLAFLTILFRL